MRRHPELRAVEIVEIDLETSDLSGAFDGIIASMTMHHIRNTDAMFRKPLARNPELLVRSTGRGPPVRDADPSSAETDPPYPRRLIEGFR